MDVTRSTIGRISEDNASKRDIPSFIEAPPPLILNPFMKPKNVKQTNLLELFEEEDSELEDLEFVQVYLRLKPCNVPNNLYEVQSDKCLITSLDTATAGHGRRTKHNVSKMYTFSHIFGQEATQKEIFEHVVKDNLRKLADGHSYTLLTYGASGSGKTYTLMGTVTSPGLVPRSLEYVFKVVEAAQQPLYKPSDRGADRLNHAEQDYEMQWVKKLRQISAPVRNKYRRMSTHLSNDMTVSHIDLSTRTKYYVWVSFVEIYNEAVYDLLVSRDRDSASSLRIREDTSGQVYVQGATQAFVRTGAEAYDVMVAGKHNLQVAATGVHARSSRSHCIFTITLLAHTDEGVRVSTVRLCDLAGAERVVRTNNVGARLKESRAINASLHVLERCLHALRRRRKQQGLVPYRESKLTRLLGAGLSGARGEAVSMVVTVNPDPALAAETRHVLQLAAVARDIHVNSTVESTLESTQDSTISSNEIMRLRAENERLHFEMARLQSQYNELLSSSEERQQRTAETMREIADRAKDMTQQFYEAQMKGLEMRLRAEMADLIEDYEDKLRSANPAATSVGTPSRSEQKLIAQLTGDIAILEEKLNVERLARARAIEEAEHLRACIEERDEKQSEDNATIKPAEDVMILDSESDDELNESLEPSFKKEDINSTVETSKSDDIESDEGESLEPAPKNSMVNNELVHKESIESIDASDTTIEPRESVDTQSMVHDSVDTITAKDSIVSYEVGSHENSVERQMFDNRGSYIVENDDSSLPKVNETKDLEESRNSSIGVTAAYVNRTKSESLLLFEQCEMHVQEEIVLEKRRHPWTIHNIPIIIITGPDESFGKVYKELSANNSPVHEFKEDFTGIVLPDRFSTDQNNEDVKASTDILFKDVQINQINDFEINKIVNTVGVDATNERSLATGNRSPSIIKPLRNSSKTHVRSTNSSELFDHSALDELKDEQERVKMSLNEDHQNIDDTSENANKLSNTAEDFENIFRNLSIARSTEFEILVSENVAPTVVSPKRDEVKKSVRYNLRQEEEANNLKYNLRHKTYDDKTSKTEQKPKKNLRLRRRKNENEEIAIGGKSKQDIANLQKEFADVTFGLPANRKQVKDIPSPEKNDGENYSCNMETMSCPSKSMTRSRRKLFTPRPEPLEESSPAGNSNERVMVPRPSYHGGRARRKL